MENVCTLCVRAFIHFVGVGCVSCMKSTLTIPTGNVQTMAHSRMATLQNNIIITSNFNAKEGIHFFLVQRPLVCECACLGYTTAKEGKGSEQK
uniref:Putative secreted peptide n=1 Tax=Anopheles braziliensis TaxID=58242 RepID=A0A2M3ZN06_9DIPT